MRNTVIGLCEQTHAASRGYACDDHINETCYSIYFETPEIEAQVIALAEKINKKSEAELYELTLFWEDNNPGEICCQEGEVFIGHTWVEVTAIMGEYDDKELPSHYTTSGTQILELLKQVE